MSSRQLLTMSIGVPIDSSFVEMFSPKRIDRKGESKEGELRKDEAEEEV